MTHEIQFGPSGLARASRVRARLWIFGMIPLISWAILSIPEIDPWWILAMPLLAGFAWTSAFPSKRSHHAAMTSGSVAHGQLICRRGARSTEYEAQLVRIVKGKDCLSLAYEDSILATISVNSSIVTLDGEHVADMDVIHRALRAAGLSLARQ